MKQKTSKQKRLSQWEIRAHLPLLKGWKHEGPRVVRVLKFKNFPAAAQYVSKLAGAGKKFKHFPDVALLGTHLRLELSTHEVGGVTELDIETAKAINKIKV